MYIEAAKRGYKILLMVSFENEETEYANIKTLLSMNVDGILIDTACTTSSHNFFDLVKKNNKPLIFFDRKIRSIDHAGVYFDDVNLSKRLTKSLINKGYKKTIVYDRASGRQY